MWGKYLQFLNWLMNDHAAAFLQQDLFPKNAMEDVTLKMEEGLSLMRDRYADLSILTRSNVDATALRATKITCPFSWDDVLSDLALASMDTAYDRYCTWYNKKRESGELKARKRTAADSEVFDENEGSAVTTRSRMRTRLC